MATQSFKVLNPIEIDFSNPPADITKPQLKKLQAHKEALDKSNFDRYIMGTVSSDDKNVLLRDIRHEVEKKKAALLKSFNGKIEYFSKDGKVNEEEQKKYSENITLLESLDVNTLSEMSWKENIDHCITILQSEDPKSNEIARSIICDPKVIASFDKIRNNVKFKRRDLEKKEKIRISKEKQRVEDKKNGVDGDDRESKYKKGDRIEDVPATTRAMEHLAVGTILLCVVQGCTDFGVFLHTYYRDALLKVFCHISDVNPEGRTVNIEKNKTKYRYGDRVTAVVTDVDVEKLRVKVSFKTRHFADLSKTRSLHKHIWGVQRDKEGENTKSKVETETSSLGSMKITLGEDTKTVQPENARFIYEEGMKLLRMMNCKSTKESTKGKRMPRGEIVKYSAEFLKQDPLQAYNRYMFIKKIKQSRARGVEMRREERKANAITEGEAEHKENEMSDDVVGDVGVTDGVTGDNHDSDSDNDDDETKPRNTNDLMDIFDDEPIDMRKRKRRDGDKFDRPDNKRSRGEGKDRVQGDRKFDKDNKRSKDNKTGKKPNNSNKKDFKKSNLGESKNNSVDTPSSVDTKTQVLKTDNTTTGTGQNKPKNSKKKDSKSKKNDSKQSKKKDSKSNEDGSKSEENNSQNNKISKNKRKKISKSNNPSITLKTDESTGKTSSKSEKLVMTEKSVVEKTTSPSSTKTDSKRRRKKKETTPSISDI